jgi:hypothetical protein
MDRQRTISPPAPPSGPTAEQLNARSIARGRRAAMRRRARRIRRSVVGLAAALFSTAFLAVYVQLASGHDPALSTKKATATASSTSTGTSNSTESSGTESSSGSSTSGSGSSGSSSSASEESSNSASAVTTSQS